MSNEPMKSVKHWRAWVQPDGPGGDVFNLGDCIDIDDISQPGGGIAAISRCWSADGSGWKTRGTTETPPDIGTGNINQEVEGAKQKLEEIKEQACGVPFYLVGAYCPPLDLFTNAEVTFFWEEMRLGDVTLTNAVRKEDEQFTMLGYAASFMPPMLTARNMVGGRQAIGENTAINDVDFGNSRKCADDCGSAEALCTVGAVCSDSPSASPAVSGDVYYTQDGGATWNLCAAQPFAGAEDALSILIFPISATSYRILVAREADPANPMEVAYSDDWGANWTLVVVGTVVGLGANWEGALHKLDPNNIWLCLDQGYIYYSSDFGATWTRQTGGAGSPTGVGLNEVWFADKDNGMAVGDTDIVLVTTDGGVTWSLATATGGGTGLRCVTENGGGGKWTVGDADGNIYVSIDHGTSWTQEEFPGDGVGVVRDVEYVNTLVGFLLHNTAAPVGSLYRTRNGGRHWEELTDVTNAGLNSLHGCTVNRAFLVGEPESGTGVILRYSD